MNIAHDLIIPGDEFRQNNQAIGNYMAELVGLPSESECLYLADSIETMIDYTEGDDPHDVGVRNGMRWCLALITKKEPEYEAFKPFKPFSWIPVTAETMPTKEGDYWVIDHRGQRAIYVYNDTASSREYWMRCAKAWAPNAGKGVAGVSDAVLKRCPFCGGEAKLLYCENGSRYSSNIYYPNKRGIVECKRCGITLPRVSAKASKAVEMWNRRIGE